MFFLSFRCPPQPRLVHWLIEMLFAEFVSVKEFLSCQSMLLSDFTDKKRTTVNSTAVHVDIHLNLFVKESTGWAGGSRALTPRWNQQSTSYWWVSFPSVLPSLLSPYGFNYRTAQEPHYSDREPDQGDRVVGEINRDKAGNSRKANTLYNSSVIPLKSNNSA